MLNTLPSTTQRPEALAIVLELVQALRLRRLNQFFPLPDALMLLFVMETLALRQLHDRDTTLATLARL
jgi:hypothetical protein